MKPPTPKIQALAHKLIGSSGYDGDVDDIGDLTSEECAMLDHLCFECVRCNWWFGEADRHTLNDEWVCTGCAEDAVENG